jgi:hypothetical protein
VTSKKNDNQRQKKLVQKTGDGSIPLKQCCGYGSGMDPDPGGQKDPQKKKTVKKFNFLKRWMFSLRA